MQRPSKNVNPNLLKAVVLVFQCFLQAQYKLYTQQRDHLLSNDLVNMSVVTIS